MENITDRRKMVYEMLNLKPKVKFIGSDTGRGHSYNVVARLPYSGSCNSKTEDLVRFKLDAGILLWHHGFGLF